MKPSEILTKAADLIEPEGAWAQGDLAFTIDGEFVYPDDDRAVCWCAAGAISAVSATDDGALSAQNILADFLDLRVRDEERDIPDRIIGKWNDVLSRRQSEVVSALRKAADLAKQQETAA